MSPDKQLFDALVTFAKSRGFELDTDPTAEIDIPAKNGTVYHVPIELLRDAPE